MNVECPVCKACDAGEHFVDIEGFSYFSCGACGSIFVSPEVLTAMDHGDSPREYGHDYWRTEVQDARVRARGDTLARAGEAILYARTEVRRFLDVGSGPGFLLDELTILLPSHEGLFHAVEMFPPDEHSVHPNYFVGDVGSMHGKFDAGVCIEVIEHLTPAMLSKLLGGLASVSHEDSLWLFNTGMPDYVRNEDPGYLDPRRRGHVVSYSLAGLRVLFEPLGFRLSELPGKSFAFLAEYRPTTPPPPFADRFYAPLSHNKKLLEEAGLLYQAAFESARSYYYQAESAERTAWALRLDAQLRAEHHARSSRGR